MGGWGALAVKLPAGFSLTGGLGVETLDENRELKSTETTATTYTISDGTGTIKETKTTTITLNPNQNMAIFGNLKYNITQTMFVGFEYTNITTKYADIVVKGKENEKVDDGKLNRFELAFNYAFK
jgi:hypothetical protein